MADKSLDIILRLKDRTRGTFSKLEKEVKGVGESAGRASKKMDGINQSIKKIDIKKVERLKTGFRDMGRGIGAAAGKLLSFRTAFIGALGTAGIGAAISSSLSAIDNLAKTSDKLGITTQALAGLRHAAELTGVETRTLDTALQRMSRRVAQAAKGTGEAKDALKELGIDARALVNLSPDKVFARIAEAMKNVGTQADKIRIAQKLFDSEGVDLINTLALGSEGLREATEEAKAYGLAISRIDAKKIEDANDAIARAKGVIRGARDSIMVDLAPAVEKLAKTLAYMAEQKAAAAERTEQRTKASRDFFKSLLGLEDQPKRYKIKQPIDEIIPPAELSNADLMISQIETIDKKLKALRSPEISGDDIVKELSDIIKELQTLDGNLKKAREFGIDITLFDQAVDAIQKSLNSISTNELKTKLDELVKQKGNFYTMGGETKKLYPDADERIKEIKQLLESARQKVEEVTGKKTLDIVAKLEGLKETAKLKKLIDSLKDKTITITTIHRHVDERAAGGLIGSFQRLGGLINRGSGLRDDVPALLTRGEYVIPKAAVNKYGINFMEALRSLSLPPAAHMAGGGLAGGSTGGSKDMGHFTLNLANESFKLSSDVLTIDKLKKVLMREKRTRGNY